MIPAAAASVLDKMFTLGLDRDLISLRCVITHLVCVFLLGDSLRCTFSTKPSADSDVVHAASVRFVAFTSADQRPDRVVSKI